MIYLQYVVNEDDLIVTGYSEISLSQNIQMNKLTPNAEGIDLIPVNGNQFDSLVLLNSTYEEIDDFSNGFYTEIRRLQTSEEGVMFLLRAILALKSSSWIEAWSSCSSVCSTGLAFIRFNEDRWQSIFRSQEASIRYYKRLQTELDNCAGDSNGNLVVEKKDGVSFQTTTSVTVTTMRKTISPTNPILNTQNKATQSTRILNCYRNSIPARCMCLRKIPLKWTVDLPRTTDFNRFESGFEKVTEGDPTENENTPSGKTSIRELSIQEICVLVQSSINADEITENDASKYHANIRGTYLENSTTSTIEVFVDSLTATNTLPCYASLQEVSALFKLTNDQHRAFFIIGRALLRSFESQSFK